MQPETKFKVNTVQPFLKSLEVIGGAWFCKIQMIALRGIPDIIGVIHGRFIALELKKSAKEKPTKLQAHILHLIERAGGYARVVCPENWEVVRAELEALYKGVG